VAELGSLGVMSEPLDMDDPFQAHAFFALTFECAVCRRELAFESHGAEFTAEWFRELASHAKQAGWAVPPPDETGSMNVMTAWCLACSPGVLLTLHIRPNTALEPTRDGAVWLPRVFRLGCAWDPLDSAFER
jgi:hypothetical protein